MYKIKSNGAILRLEDNVFIPPVDGNRDYQEYLEWISKNNIAEIESLDKQKLLNDAWISANNFAQDNMDANSRHSIANLTTKLALGQLEQWQAARINAYWQWWETLWSHYETVKREINEGLPSTFNPQIVGKCPYTIWELVENI